MSDSIQKRPTWLYRLSQSLGLVRAYQRLISSPKQPVHGASWTNPLGARQSFSPMTSMSAYAGHAYTHACASRASQDLAALPLVLVTGGRGNEEIIDDHPFLDLMDQPNTRTDGFLFREQLLIDLMLSGNCYVLIVGDLSAPSSLFRLHPQNVKIVTSRAAGLEGYEYTDGGVAVMYPAERVVHSRNASWANEAGGELYGTGAVESLAKEINADINAQKLASETSAQGRPDILLSPRDDADIWGKERRREILDSYRNMSQRGGAMVLSGQVDVKPLNLSPREMEFEAARKMARENISAVLGVPSTILGLPDANYATARQSNLTYWQIQTKRARKMDIMFTAVARLWDPRLRVRHDYAEVESLQDARNARLDRIASHISNGMPAADAYAYEGLQDAPIDIAEVAEVEAVEVAEVEELNLRSVERLFELVGTEKKSLKFRTPQEKSTYWRDWISRAVDPAEREMRRVTQAYLTSAAGRYAAKAAVLISASRAFDEQRVKAIDWAGIFDRLGEVRRMKDTIGRFWNDTWVLTGNEVLDEIYSITGMDKPLDLVFSERRLSDRMIGRNVREISKTSEKQVRRVVRDGIKAGWSNTEIGEAIRQSSTFDEARAQMIAQTETTRAINMATVQAYKVTEEREGITIFKEWISSEDDKVRETHRILNESPPIPAGEMFEVDGQSGLAPGDFSDAAMVINCRCTVAPIVMD